MLNVRIGKRHDFVGGSKLGDKSNPIISERYNHKYDRVHIPNAGTMLVQPRDVEPALSRRWISDLVHPVPE